MLVKLDHFPSDPGEKKKYLSCHHPEYDLKLQKDSKQDDVKSKNDDSKQFFSTHLSMHRYVPRCSYQILCPSPRTSSILLLDSASPMFNRNFQRCAQKAIILPASLTASFPLKISHPKRKGSSSNHHFSGAMLNFGGVLEISYHRKGCIKSCK